MGSLTICFIFLMWDYPLTNQLRIFHFLKDIWLIGHFIFGMFSLGYPRGKGPAFAAKRLEDIVDWQAGEELMITAGMPSAAVTAVQKSWGRSGCNLLQGGASKIETIGKCGLFMGFIADL